MQALGLATYASTSRQPLETIKAREYYGSAIVKVNIALQSEVYSKRDSTLLAVVILTYFETMAGSDRGGIAAWSKHIDGTAALIQKRGVEQMRTAEGRTLFLLATANMISNCTRLALRIPESIHAIWKEGLKDLGLSSDPIWRVHSAWLKLVDFYSDVVNERKDFTVIVSEAFEIDRELATAFDNASTLWEYDVKPSRIRSILPHLPEYSHLYKFPLSVQMWNAARGGRIMLHSIISRALWHISLATPSATGEHHAEQLRKSDKLVRRMKMDVLASVPQLLGFEVASEAGESQPPATYTDIATMTQNFESPIPIPPGSGSSGLLTLRSDHLPVLRTCGFNFIWTLGLVGRNTKKADPLRGTVCSYLRLAGARLGLQMAFLFAETLERGEMLTMT